MRRFLVILLLSLIGSLPMPAAAATNCLGRITPGPATARFYLDAVHGRDGADGRSPSTAWRSFAAVVGGGRLNPAIPPGAVIILADGEYGPLVISNLHPSSPPDPEGRAAYISFLAAPGAHPVVASLLVSGSERLLFSGLRFQSQSGLGRFQAVVRINGSASAPSRDIRVLGNEIGSGATYREWSQAEWEARAPWAGVVATGNPHGSVRCVEIAGNTIHGIGMGAMLIAEDSRIANNDFHDFGLDGIDFSGDRIDIVGNRLIDNLAMPIANHNDMIQGLRRPPVPGPDGKPLASHRTWYDVHIVGNVMIRQVRPGLRLAGTTQGITGFADTWERLVVANNVIVIGGPRRVAERLFYNASGRGELPFSVFRPCTTETLFRRQPAAAGVGAGGLATVPTERLGWLGACGTHAITFGTVRHGAIVNNTVMTDNAAMTMAGVWIKPLPDAVGPTCDTIIANNLANWSNLTALRGTLVPSAPANAAARTEACTPGRIRNFVGGNLDLDATRPGGIDPRRVFLRHRGFANADAQSFDIDLHLAPGSPAVGTGSAALARAALGPMAKHDVEGRLRRRSDIGAYAF